MYFYGYGALLTIISIGFYISAMGNSTVDTNAKKTLFKLILSITAGWYLIVIFTGSNFNLFNDSIMYKIIIVFTGLIAPVVLHLGLQMGLYGKFKDE